MRQHNGLSSFISQALTKTAKKIIINWAWQTGGRGGVIFYFNCFEFCQCEVCTGSGTVVTSGKQTNLYVFIKAIAGTP